MYAPSLRFSHLPAPPFNLKTPRFRFFLSFFFTLCGCTAYRLPMYLPRYVEEKKPAQTLVPNPPPPPFAANLLLLLKTTFHF
ncbi:hypothetical protein F4775DRAFT_103445 [Biscogniauxia sp. FL1348]|nr:hypothetical protein F4775DRAFT_103445 [Biscogniauxia sp. FL1348]